MQWPARRRLRRKARRISNHKSEHSEELCQKEHKGHKGTLPRRRDERHAETGFSSSDEHGVQNLSRERSEHSHGREAPILTRAKPAFSRRRSRHLTRVSETNEHTKEVIEMAKKCGKGGKKCK